jgi:hypothetical protein
MKKAMSDAGSSQDSQKLRSWKEDVYAQVKGPDKRGRMRCVGTLPISKKSCSLPNVNYEERQQVLEEEISNLKETLTSVLSVMQKRFPEDLSNIIREANNQRQV